MESVEKEENGHDPKHTTSSMKHGGGHVMSWACMVASGMGSLVFINDMTANRSRTMNSEVYRNISMIKPVVLTTYWTALHHATRQ